MLLLNGICIFWIIGVGCFFSQLAPAMQSAGSLVICTEQPFFENKKNLPFILTSEGSFCRCQDKSTDVPNSQGAVAAGFLPLLSGLLSAGSAFWNTPFFPTRINQQALLSPRQQKLPVIAEQIYPESSDQLTPNKRIQSHLIPEDLPGWQQQVLQEKWQWLTNRLSALPVATDSSKPEKVQIYLSITHRQIRVATVFQNTAGLLETETLLAQDLQEAIYELLIGAFRQLPETHLTLMAAGDDGDKDDPDRSSAFVDDDLNIFLHIPLLHVTPNPSDDKITWSVRHRRSQLQTLRIRVQQAIEQGDQSLAQILNNRIMVIEADVNDLLYLAREADSADSSRTTEIVSELFTTAFTLTGEQPAGRQMPVTTPASGGSAQSLPVAGDGQPGNPGQSQKLSDKVSGKGGDNNEDDDKDGKRQPPDKSSEETLPEERTCSFCGRPINKTGIKVISGKPLISATLPESSDNPLLCDKCLNADSTAGILNLPDELLLIIVTDFGLKDVLNLRLTCRKFRQLSENYAKDIFTRPLSLHVLGCTVADSDPRWQFGDKDTIRKRLTQCAVPDFIKDMVYQQAPNSRAALLVHQCLLQNGRIRPIETAHTKWIKPNRDIPEAAAILSDGRIAIAYEFRGYATRCVAIWDANLLRHTLLGQLPGQLPADLDAPEKILEVAENQILVVFQARENNCFCLFHTDSENQAPPRLLTAPEKGWVLLAKDKLLFIPRKKSKIMHLHRIKKGCIEPFYTVSSHHPIAEVFPLSENLVFVVSYELSGTLMVWPLQNKDSKPVDLWITEDGEKTSVETGIRGNFLSGGRLLQAIFNLRIYHVLSETEGAFSCRKEDIGENVYPDQVIQLSEQQVVTQTRERLLSLNLDTHVVSVLRTEPWAVSLAALSGGCFIVYDQHATSIWSWNKKICDINHCKPFVFTPGTDGLFLLQLQKDILSKVDLYAVAGSEQHPAQAAVVQSEAAEWGWMALQMIVQIARDLWQR